MADIFFSAQRLEAIAASEVINIFYSIQCIIIRAIFIRALQEEILRP